MITQAEAAAVLGLALRTMRAIPADKLPRYKVGPRGGLVRYRRADLEAYILASREAVPGKIVRRRVGRPDGKPLRHV
jgi:hypothetical protein